VTLNLDEDDFPFNKIPNLKEIRLDSDGNYTLNSVSSSSIPKSSGSFGGYSFSFASSSTFPYYGHSIIDTKYIDTKYIIKLKDGKEFKLSEEDFKSFYEHLCMGISFEDALVLANL